VAAFFPPSSGNAPTLAGAFYLYTKHTKKFHHGVAQTKKEDILDDII